MMPFPHRRLARCALASFVGVALAGTAPGQGPTPRSETSLSAAWLVEHMRHAPSVRRQVELYERALRDASETTESRAVAAARLLEIDRVLGDGDRLDAHENQLQELLGSETGASRTALELHREELAQALGMPRTPERTAALRAAREQIDADLRSTRVVSRSVVWLLVRRLAADRDAERARLERELSAARTEGDAERARQLEDRLRASRGLLRSNEVDRMRAWRVRLLRLLAEGRLEQAEVLRERLTVDGNPAEEPLTRARRALQDASLTGQERSALEEFFARWETWQRTSPEIATRALRLLPY
ncbi:MAG: hypothetical protein ACO4CT_16765 [Planctomycetota bacterium]